MEPTEKQAAVAMLKAGVSPEHVVDYIYASAYWDGITASFRCITQPQEQEIANA